MTFAAVNTEFPGRIERLGIRKIVPFEIRDGRPLVQRSDNRMTPMDCPLLIFTHEACTEQPA